MKFKFPTSHPLSRHEKALKGMNHPDSHKWAYAVTGASVLGIGAVVGLTFWGPGQGGLTPAQQHKAIAAGQPDPLTPFPKYVPSQAGPPPSFTTPKESPFQTQSPSSGTNATPAPTSSGGGTTSQGVPASPLPEQPVPGSTFVPPAVPPPGTYPQPPSEAPPSGGASPSMCNPTSGTFAHGSYKGVCNPDGTGSLHITCDPGYMLTLEGACIPVTKP